MGSRQQDFWRQRVLARVVSDHNAALTAHKTHAYVFVMLKGDERPDFYIVPSEFVAIHQSGAISMPEFRRADAGPYLERWSILKEKHPHKV